MIFWIILFAVIVFISFLLADFHVINDSTLNGLKIKIEEIYGKIANNKLKNSLNTQK